MKKFLVYLSSLILIFTQISSTANAVTIEKKLKINKISNCTYLYKENFDKYTECLNNEILDSSQFNKLSVKKKKDIVSLLSIANILSENIEDKFLEEEKVVIIWQDILTTKYKGNIKKKKLSKILDDSSCLDKNNYSIFIRCFANEFRNLGIYKSSDLLTKRRIETIMINSLYLSKKDSIVYAETKSNLLDGIKYENSDGFDFFFTLMNGLGNDYFNEKEKEIDWKKIITFIVIAIIIALIAKKVLKKGSSGGASQSSTSTNSAASSAGNPLNNPRGYYNQLPVKYNYSTKIRYVKPYIDLQAKPWFKVIMKSRFGF